jgi:rhodanese-related sulfurtransferase
MLGMLVHACADSTKTMDAFRPRINGALLKQSAGREVVLVCKVTGVSGNAVRVLTSDDHPVDVLLDDAPAVSQHCMQCLLS